MIAFRLGAVLAVTFAAGCATHIAARDETIRPASVRLGTFQSVVLRPLVVEQSGEDSGDHAAVKRIESELLACLRQPFPAIKLVEPGVGAGGTSTLVIEPSIPDMKKVNFSERFWLGPMAGSSAVLLRTRYTNAATGEVVADPTFYAKANAWGGAFSFAATDNKMLTRLVNDACSYGRSNL